MKYELAYIINPVMPETEHSALNERLLSMLKEAGASISVEPFFMGRKKLAYPIKKQKHGFYYYVQFELEERSKLKDLDKKLKHDTEILRYLVIKLDGVYAKLKPFTKTVRDLVVKPRPVARPAGRPRSVSRPAPAVAAEPVTIVPEKPVAESLTLEDIDKKLDEILSQEPKID